MPSTLQRLLREATRLTRAGDLLGATRTIQQALGGRAPAEGGDVIDVAAREVPGGAAALPAGDRDGAPDEARHAPAGGAAPVHAPGAALAGVVQQQSQPQATAEPRPVPSPESFTDGRWGGPGTAGREYKLYLPPDADHEPRPLVVLLHGCTQGPDDFALGTQMNALAREEGVVVLYPSQAQRANPQRCWNWFKASHQGRDRGEPQIVVGMVREVMATHAIDPARVYVAGLSAGGAMAANLAAAYPELFAAVGVHSGLPAGAATDLPSAMQAMKEGAERMGPLRVPTIVFHGDADHTVHPVNGERVAQSAAGADARWAVETGSRLGRRFTRRIHADHATGRVNVEHWVVHGAGHVWSGGNPRGSYADAQGPDAAGEMLRFFLEHPRRP